MSMHRHVHAHVYTHVDPHLPAHMSHTRAMRTATRLGRARPHSAARHPECALAAVPEAELPAAPGPVRAELPAAVPEAELPEAELPAVPEPVRAELPAVGPAAVPEADREMWCVAAALAAGRPAVLELGRGVPPAVVLERAQGWPWMAGDLVVGRAAAGLCWRWRRAAVAGRAVGRAAAVPFRVRGQMAACRALAEEWGRAARGRAVGLEAGAVGCQLHRPAGPEEGQPAVLVEDRVAPPHRGRVKARAA